jgi:amidase
VKDEITTYGSKIYRDYRPDHTAPTVQRLLDAGAIMHCRTTTPEFAHTGVTASPLWGITRNPWNLEYTPGGSSEGAGAVLAAGMTTLADGTDGGGSIRIPASVNGIVGYKPPFGRNPLDLDHPLETILHYGPMTRSVSDAALMQNIMSGPHLDDICTVRDKIVLPEVADDIKGWRVAYSMDLGFYTVDPEVRRNILTALEVFKSLGCTVEEVNVGWNWGVNNAWMTYWTVLYAGLLGDRLPRWRYEMTEGLVRMIEGGATCSAPSSELSARTATQLTLFEPIGSPSRPPPSGPSRHRRFGDPAARSGHDDCRDPHSCACPLSGRSESGGRGPRHRTHGRLLRIAISQ